MKVIIINGSPRVSGATGRLLQRAAERLSENGGLEVEYVDLSKLKMEFCRGCESCYKMGGCIVKDDDLETLAEKIRRVDGIILGTPTYGSNVSGQMKVLIDRGHFVMEQRLTGKEGLVISTYENAYIAGRSALKILQRLIQYAGGTYRAGLLLKFDHNSDPLKDKAVQGRLDRAVDRYYQALMKRKRKPFFQRIFHAIILNIGLKPRVQRHPQNYAQVIKEWRTLGLLS